MLRESKIQFNKLNFYSLLVHRGLKLPLCQYVQKKKEKKQHFHLGLISVGFSQAQEDLRGHNVGGFASSLREKAWSAVKGNVHHRAMSKPILRPKTKKQSTCQWKTCDHQLFFSVIYF